MKTRVTGIDGEATFYTFAYLWQAAQNAFASTKSNPDEGSNYQRISAVLFAAFTFEAHLNHVGSARCPDWDLKERRLRWQDKLALVASTIGIVVDRSKRPMQTVQAIFKLRDGLAHGKTQAREGSGLIDKESVTRFKQKSPEWLAKYWSDIEVKRVLDDTWELLKEFQEKAGFSRESLFLVGGATVKLSLETISEPRIPRRISASTAKMAVLKQSLVNPKGAN